MAEMKLEDLKSKSPTEMLAFAEEYGVENASTMRKQELMFAVLKQLAAKEIEIIGTGVVEVMMDGFGFLRSPDSNYLPGPDDIYVSPLPDPPVRAAHRGYGRGSYPQPEGGRAVLRAAEGQPDQLREPGGGQAQGQLRQPDAALPDEVAEARDRGSDDKGSVATGDRHRGADRQGPARIDRRAAAHG